MYNLRHSKLPSDNPQNQFEYFSQLAGPEYDNDIALTADLMDLAPIQELTELPLMMVLAYTAVRSLRYQELAIAYAVHSRMVTMVLKESSTCVSCLHKQIPFVTPVSVIVTPDSVDIDLY